MNLTKLIPFYENIKDKIYSKDRCTFFPDSMFGIDLKMVCYKHDLRYRDHDKSRWTADMELFNDVKTRGNKAITVPLGAAMWLGVRLGGWIPYYFKNKE